MADITDVVNRRLEGIGRPSAVADSAALQPITSNEVSEAVVLYDAGLTNIYRWCGLTAESCTAVKATAWASCFFDACPAHRPSKRFFNYFPRRRWQWNIDVREVTAFVRDNWDRTADPYDPQEWEVFRRQGDASHRTEGNGGFEEALYVSCDLVQRTVECSQVATRPGTAVYERVVLLKLNLAGMLGVLSSTDG